MPSVDLAFRLTGSRLPVDHGYALYSAISRSVPALHEARDVGLHLISGRYAGGGLLQLTSASRLTIRMPGDCIHHYLPLAGGALDMDGSVLRVGIPEVQPLRPFARLYARLVTIKGFMEPEVFLTAAQRQLQKAGVSVNLQLGARKTFRVKDKQIVGFEALAVGLDADDSVRLQEVGIGGRRHMGCGVFVPFRR
jgi:CRISPR-associated protein Cas6